jgi:hypothetical protein
MHALSLLTSELCDPAPRRFVMPSKPRAARELARVLAPHSGRAIAVL